MKSEIDTVIEDKAIKRMTLSMKIKWFEELTEIVNKNPNKNPENDVSSALSLIMDP